MRLFKLLVALVVLCLIAIFIYENMQTWVQPVSFKLNLYFNEQHDTAGIEQYLVILISALSGFIIGLAALVKPYFRTRRQLKRERLEKKQALEQLALRQAGAESHGEAAGPSVQTDQ